MKQIITKTHLIQFSVLGSDEIEVFERLGQLLSDSTAPDQIISAWRRRSYGGWWSRPERETRVQELRVTHQRLRPENHVLVWKMKRRIHAARCLKKKYSIRTQLNFQSNRLTNGKTVNLSKSIKVQRLSGPEEAPQRACLHNRKTEKRCRSKKGLRKG